MNQRERQFADIFHGTRDKLYAFLRMYSDDTGLVEDIMQTCYLKVWEDLDKWSDVERLLPLIKTIARNQLLNEIRKKARLPLEWLNESMDVEHTDAPVRSALQALDEAIESLPEKCKEVYILHREKRLSYGEIATYLSISPETVKNHMSKAIRLLQQRLEVSELLVAGMVLYSTLTMSMR